MAEAGNNPNPQDKAATQAAIDAAVAALAARSAAAAAGKKAKPQDQAKKPEPPKPQAQPAPQPKVESKPGQGLDFIHEMAPTRKLPVLPVLLGLNGLLIIGVIAVVLKVVMSPPEIVESSTTSIEIGTESISKPAHGLEPEPPAASRLVVRVPRAVSWEQAEKDYRQGNYEDALAQYTQLVGQWQKLPGDHLVYDFLRLRLANCLVQLNDVTQGRQFYQTCMQSASPVVRAAALYQTAALDLSDGQHYRARAMAMQALVAACASESSALKDFQTQCDYLAARALTEKALGLWGGQWAVPWKDIPQADPLAGLDEKQLRAVLAQGAAAELPLTPAVATVASTGAPLYAVRCVQAPLEDVLAKIASTSGMEVRWGNVEGSLRQRAVTLSLSGVNAPRAIELACGVAGLMSRCVGSQADIMDVGSIADLSQQRLALANEAEAAWRRFALRYADDRREGEALYAIAGMMETRNEPAAAVSEYQLIANNYRRFKLAPQALYRCAYLRLGLKEYAKARKDLTELLDLFPDYAALDQVELSLGQATMEEGLYADALKIVERVYYRQMSPATQAGAALAAGLCQQHLGQHDQAIKWLSLYLDKDKKGSPASRAKADLALARSYLAVDKPLAAVGCLQEALQARAGGELTVEAGLLLAEVQSSRGRHGGALSALAQLANETLTDQQNFQYVLGTLRAYRASGLTDKAIAFGRKKSESVRNPQHSAIVQAELARCYRDSGDLANAQRLMTTAMLQLPREETAAATVELAEISLDLNKPLQTTALLEGMVSSIKDTALRQKAARALGSAYMQLNQPQKTAAVYAAAGLAGGGQ